MSADVLRFTLPVPPSANRWWRSIRTPKGLGRVIKSKAAREYLDRLRVPVQGFIDDGDVVVTVVWFRAERRGDLDKRLPVLLDVLQGIAYRSDAQIVELHARRDDSDRRHPRMEVAVQRA